ncbi:MAG: hypothetical protein ACWGQW_07030 [bacterium]
MSKFKVRYELRSQHVRTTEAESVEHAEEIVCEESWRRHRDSIYDILLVEVVGDDGTTYEVKRSADYLVGKK